MKFVKAKKFSLAFLTTLISLAALSGSALAGDNKVYSGSTCKPVSETGATGLFYGHNATNLGNANVNRPPAKVLTG